MRIAVVGTGIAGNVASFHLGREHEPALLAGSDEGPTLGDYLAAGGYSRQFVEHYIVPMGAAIWSTAPELVQRFPARFFVRFFHNHGMLSVDERPQWRVVRGGSARYVEKLTVPFRDRIRLQTPVEWVRRLPGQVLVKARGHEVESYDAVFLACHSDQALRLLADPTREEREVLGAIPYQPNEAVLHTDARLLPRSRRAWAAWNHHLPIERRAHVAPTYNMNILQSLDAPEPFLVSLNHSEAIDPGKIVKRIAYSRRQHELAVERVAAAGLEDRVTVLLEDDRDLDGSFDKLVSIEMIEAVGHQFYDTYFAQCGRLLKDDGLMLLQAITIADQRYDSARRSVDFIQRHIFPGSTIPSVTAMQDSITRSSDLRLAKPGNRREPLLA
ncbi:MAG: class I SAM-dependent methyltransferase [Steroidobacteraceae bacterium]